MKFYHQEGESVYFTKAFKSTIIFWDAQGKDVIRLVSNDAI
jgi:hypothetical protein